MMLQMLEIFKSSFKMALQELWKSKLRTFLSLFGVTIGIFCIISVMAVVSSLEYNIRREISSLGSNTIFIDKWEYAADITTQYPWWKYVNRPLPKYSQVEEIKNRTNTVAYAAFRIAGMDAIEYNGGILSDINYYGVSEDFNQVQPVDLEYGRYINVTEFDRGGNVVVIGNEVAVQFFSQAERALGKVIVLRGRKVQVVGVMKKQGQQMIGGWNFDESVIIPYNFSKSVMNERRSDPVIIVMAQSGVSVEALKNDLAGTMRALNKLNPKQENNFSLNSIDEFSNMLKPIFASLNLGGLAITLLSLIVGMFGVANIMFVTVRERTGQIGLKKAIGAKNYIILLEFLLESSFLCVIGGLIGLLMVYGVTKLITLLFDFPIFISANNIIVALVTCIVVGVLSGLIPAIQAAKMKPVEAIRS